jgi:hypothetical protein
MIPTFENFQQGQTSLHEGANDYVGSFRTNQGKNIIITLKNWGKFTNSSKEYEEGGFQIYEALSDIFKDKGVQPKEIIVKY